MVMLTKEFQKAPKKFFIKVDKCSKKPLKNTLDIALLSLDIHWEVVQVAYSDRGKKYYPILQKIDILYITDNICKIFGLL